MYGKKLSWNTWFKLVHRWADHPKTTYSVIHRELGVDENTIRDVYFELRDITSVWIEEHQSQDKLGRAGIIVEIDESLFNKRKYNKGRWCKQMWVFGGVQRGSNKVFMHPVEKRDRATLLSIIHERIANNSIIMSDG
uniref:Transposase n=1 Tax=Panagrolaimus superbus TaxID=310955 RepID=A0A914ZDF9_9BILA